MKLPCAIASVASLNWANIFAFDLIDANYRCSSPDVGPLSFAWFWLNPPPYLMAVPPLNLDLFPVLPNLGLVLISDIVTLPWSTAFLDTDDLGNMVRRV